ncbi:MAG: hypothetical protein IAG13_38410 [Deltaproteobacteria bacterium]|nr:hypothetical protein [Nannocystaceae bacterium]
MSHCIQALVFPGRLSAPARARIADARTARLAQGFVLMPISDDILDQLGDTAVPRRSENSNRLSVGVVRLARELSAIAPIAYVETDYFGGVGTQCAAAWVNGAEAVQISSDSGVISTALRALGVSRDGATDEFEAVGLQRFRDNASWLESGEPG